MQHYLLADLLHIQYKQNWLQCDLGISSYFLKKFSTGGEKLKNRKVFFKDPASGHDRIQFDGCPYIIVG